MLLPKSFCVPNLYIDELCWLLTPTEFVVLLCLVRATIGWNRNCAAVSLDMLEHGVTRNGERVAYGCGLARSTIQKALDNLSTFKIVSRERANRQSAYLYQINLESEQIDLPALLQRKGITL